MLVFIRTAQAGCRIKPAMEKYTMPFVDIRDIHMYYEIHGTERQGGLAYIKRQV